MKKIIYQPWGGLGDNLQFSTLPELFHNQGHDVYISQKNAYRNIEILDLVWKLNPFIKGFINEMPNCGSCVPYKRIEQNKSIIFNQEICHNVVPINEIPKIYYEPKKNKKYENAILVDLSAFSTKPIQPSNFNEKLKKKHKNEIILIPNFVKKVDSEKVNNFQFDDKIDINSIFEFIDIIYSCKYFYCSLSGQNALAAAINKKETTVFIAKKWQNVDWCFPNLNYQIIHE